MEDTKLPLWSFKGHYDNRVFEGESHLAAVSLALKLNIFAVCMHEGVAGSQDV